MGKFILIVLALVVLVFSAFSFALGLLRRFLGIAPRATRRTRPREAPQSSVLYHDSRTEVLRGDSTPPQKPGYANIRDASFTEGKTGTSPRR